MDAVEKGLESHIGRGCELPGVLKARIVEVAAADGAEPVVAPPLPAVDVALPVDKGPVARAPLAAHHLAKGLPDAAAVVARAAGHLAEAKGPAVKVVHHHVILVPAAAAKQAPRQPHCGVIGLDSVVVDVHIGAKVVLFGPPQEGLIKLGDAVGATSAGVHPPEVHDVGEDAAGEGAGKAVGARTLGDDVVLVAHRDRRCVQDALPLGVVGVGREVVLVHEPLSHLGRDGDVRVRGLEQAHL
mmetsp:Transcript_15660/g.42043  ORF Transcript_15660/g.42043 Transcript_15660/m.42043 type:complete len:242 (+) Transcript_15660:858-1583(+)